MGLIEPNNLTKGALVSGLGDVQVCYGCFYLI